MKLSKEVKLVMLNSIRTSRNLRDAALNTPFIPHTNQRLLKRLLTLELAEYDRKKNLKWTPLGLEQQKIVDTEHRRRLDGIPFAEHVPCSRKKMEVFEAWHTGMIKGRPVYSNGFMLLAGTPPDDGVPRRDRGDIGHLLGIERTEINPILVQDVDLDRSTKEAQVTVTRTEVCLANTEYKQWRVLDGAFFDVAVCENEPVRWTTPNGRNHPVAGWVDDKVVCMIMPLRIDSTREQDLKKQAEQVIDLCM